MSQHTIPAEAGLALRRRRARLPPRRPARRRLMHETARRYGVSEQTLSRVLRQQGTPRAVPRRIARGSPRVLPQSALERSRERIAAVKVRPTHGTGRHLSTGEAIRLGEDEGLETSAGWVQAPKGVRKTAPGKRDLQRWGLDGRTWRRAPPAVRFQAQPSNEWWPVASSPSDRKQLKGPPWVDPTKGSPTLRLYSVGEDRSGVA